MIESLHNHTTTSDGVMTHQELFDLAQEKGFSVLAFTDHDAVPGEEVVKQLESLRDQKLKWIIGTEITAVLPQELNVPATLHMIGLFVDPFNKELLEHTKKAQAARVERMVMMVKNLRDLGYVITVDDCLRASNGDSVGRPHIVMALGEYEENQLVTDRLVEEMKRDAEHDEEIKKKFERMIANGPENYLYDLVLSGNAYKRGYVEITYVPSFDEAVRLIRNAGGIATLAHYFTFSKHVPLNMVREMLKSGRIDGMETIYGLHSLGGALEPVIHDERRALKDIVHNTGAIASGGGDIHTKEDLELYVNAHALTQESVGMTEAILSTGKVDRRWSSL